MLVLADGVRCHRAAPGDVLAGTVISPRLGLQPGSQAQRDFFQRVGQADLFLDSSLATTVGLLVPWAMQGAYLLDSLLGPRVRQLGS